MLNNSAGFIDLYLFFGMKVCNTASKAPLFICSDRLGLLQCCFLFVSSDLEHKNASLKEKQQAISEVLSEIEQKELQKDDIIQKIQRLKEDQAKRKDCKLKIKLHKNKLN